MATRDRYAKHFEDWIKETISEQDFPEDQDKHSLEIQCPCCETGVVRMQINTRFQSVMAECSNHEEGKCGSHKVSMPYNYSPKKQMVANGE